MSIAIEVYEKTQVGATGASQARGSEPAVLEAFQAVVSDFESLEAEGLIEITTKHRESQTGNRYVALVMFKRLA